MDPQAALHQLLEAIHDQDRDRAIDHLEALTQWITRGGFLPTVHAVQPNGLIRTVFLVQSEIDEEKK